MIDVSRKRFDRVLIDIINNTTAISYSRDGGSEIVIQGNGYRAMHILSRTIYDEAVAYEHDEYNTKMTLSLREGAKLNVDIVIIKDDGEFSQLIVTDDNGYKIYHTVSDIKVVAEAYGVSCKDAFLGGIHERMFYIDLGDRLAYDPTFTFYELDLRSGSILSEQRIAAPEQSIAAPEMEQQ